MCANPDLLEVSFSSIPTGIALELVVKCHFLSYKKWLYITIPTKCSLTCFV
jgi:hypothetical protein